MKLDICKSSLIKRITSIDGKIKTTQFPYEVQLRINLNYVLIFPR